MMIRRGDRKYREFECSECEIKRHIYEIERENLGFPAQFHLFATQIY